MQVNHTIVENFFMWQICLNAFRENKILAKISEFTVLETKADLQ